jgi:aminomethyltransferase
MAPEEKTTETATGTAGAGSVMRYTALHGRHTGLGAKLADFGGWEMPIEYPGGGVLREHEAVRARVGLFDVSHLGKLAVTGSGAAAFVDSCLTNDLSRIGPGQAQYTLCCDDRTGGVVDDLIVYLRSADDVLLVPNAANSAEVARRLRAAAPDGITIVDRHDDLAVLAVQGPLAEEVVAGLGLPTDHDYMAFAETTWPGAEAGVGADGGAGAEAGAGADGGVAAGSGASITVCRTGYTGERGYELLVPAELAESLWDVLLAAVRERGGLPCGLGSRDTLRTEMGYPLHGHELSLGITPVQARVGWAVGWRKPAFWGRDVLLAERERGAARRAWGLVALSRGVPRADLPVRPVGDGPGAAGGPDGPGSTDGAGAAGGSDGSGGGAAVATLGVTTSGTFSPTLKQGIALALLDASVAEGDEVVVDVRGRPLRCRVVKPPFVDVQTR